MICMTLKDILESAKKYEIGLGEFDKFSKIRGYNGVAELYSQIYDTRDPTISAVISDSPKMEEPVRRDILLTSVGALEKKVVDGVTSSPKEAFSGFKKKEGLVNYLLGSSIEPKVHAGNQRFMDMYDGAYKAARLLQAVKEQDQEQIAEAVNDYVTSEIERLKKAGVDDGMIKAVVWVYQNNSGRALSRVVEVANNSVKEFSDKVDFDEARNYAEERFTKLDEEVKKKEAIIVGRTILKEK